MKAIVSSLAAFLALVAPFSGFVIYHDYSFLTAEILIIFLTFALVATVAGTVASFGGRAVQSLVFALLTMLVIDNQLAGGIGMNSWAISTIIWLGTAFIIATTLFWLLHENIAKILLTVFLSLLVMVIVNAPNPLVKEASGAKEPIQNSKLPTVVHIVLDGQLAIEGIPTDIAGGRDYKAFMKSFYAEIGAAIYGKTFAHRNISELTLGSLFTLEEQPVTEVSERKPAGWKGRFRGEGAFNHILKDNRFFERIKTLGYNLNIFQIDYLDICNGLGKYSGTCKTYQIRSLKAVEGLPISAISKLRPIMSSYLEPFLTYKVVRKAYRLLSHLGLPLPYWEWERTVNSAVSGIQILKDMKADIAQAQPGQFFFGHAMVPHFPYMYDRNCKVLEPVHWLTNTSERAADPDRWRGKLQLIKNTRETRAERYQLYFNQSRCAHKLIGEIVKTLRERKLFNDSIIIIHGDHGSRMPLFGISNTRKDPLSDSDMVDLFSTHFAIKAPGMPAGYDTRLISIQPLFSRIVQKPIWSILDDSNLEEVSQRILFKDSAGPLREMPNFGAEINTGIIPPIKFNSQ